MTQYPERRKRSQDDDYAREGGVRDKQAEISRRKIAAGQEIGPLPAVADPERRAKSLADFYFFASTYFPDLFEDPFSDNHRYNIDIVTQTKGSLRHVFNLPRRWGKTTTMVIVLLWLIFRGDVFYAYIVAANEDKAEEILESLLHELDKNELLLDDFPEICWPFHCLERRASRSSGQKLNGVRTSISITGGEIRFPVVEGSQCGGAIITASGIQSKQLGSRKRVAKGAVRPDFILLDDIQDEESSGSFTQTEKIKKKVQKTFKYLPDKKKPCKIVINCTVRNRDDLADSYLKDVRWSGQRCGLFDKMPTDLTAWRGYGEEQERLYEFFLDVASPEQKEKQIRNSLNKYYIKNRVALESGFQSHWEYAKTLYHISSIQAGMENWLEDEVAFWSEDMNTPMVEIYQDSEDLDIDAIIAKVIPTKQGLLPNDTGKIVAAIDIHEDVLMWLTLAGGEDFSTHVVDYGIWPEQRSRSIVQPENVPVSISDKHPGLAMEDAVFESIGELVEMLLDRRFTREDGSAVKLSRIFIDAKYGPLTPTIRKFCKVTKHQGEILHSFSAERNKFTTGKKQHEIWDPNNTWKIPPAKTVGSSRYMLFDGNHWKTFALKRVQASVGNRSTLTIYNGNKSHHAQLISDWTAEYHETIVTKAGTETRWKDKPGKKNRSHLWDCLVMCFVALSEQGLSLASTQSRKTERKKVSFSEMQRQAKERQRGTR